MEKINLTPEQKDKLERDAMWKRLCEHEPRLKALQEEILSLDGESVGFCAKDYWYGYTHEGLIYKLATLVGSSRHPHPVLGTYEAGELAQDILYWDSLPPCRGCNCHGMSAAGEKQIDETAGE